MYRIYWQRNIGKKESLSKPVPEIVCEFDDIEDTPKVYATFFGKTYSIAHLVLRDNEFQLKLNSIDGSEILFNLLEEISEETKFNFRILSNCRQKTLIVTYCDEKWYCYYSYTINDKSKRIETIDVIINALSQLPVKLKDAEPTIKKRIKNRGSCGRKSFSIDDIISQDRVIIKMIINLIWYLFGEDAANDRLLGNMKLFASGKIDKLDNELNRRVIPYDELIELYPHTVKFYFNKSWHCQNCLFDEFYFDYKLPIDLSSYISIDVIKEYIVDW